MELIVETSLLDDVKLKEDITEAQETAEEAYTTATKAVSIAGNNDQYFWHSQTGTDTGAHITLVSQETFKANPRGANLLARNNGVAIRDGLLEVAVFNQGGTFYNAYVNNQWQQVAAYTPTYMQIGATVSGKYNVRIDASGTAANNGFFVRNGTTNLSKWTSGSIVFYDGTANQYELAKFDTSGLTLKNSNNVTTFIAGNNGLSVYDGVSTEYELLELSATGLVLKDNTGLQYASFGGNAIIGRTARGYSRTSITSGGMKVLTRPNNSDTDVTLAHIGYDTGQSSSGSTSSSKAPYYTFGTRSSPDTSSTRGNYSFAEGVDVTASGYTSHAEGYHTTASGSYSHAEGSYATASGLYSHAEGNDTTASSTSCHAEGYGTTASAPESHAEGFNCKATNHYSHAEGDNTTASGRASHAAGFQTVAGYAYQTVVGKYNNNKSTSLFEVGNGSSTSARANAFAVTETGALEIGAPTTTFIVRSASSTASFTGTHTFDLTAPTVSGYTPICFLNWNITGSTKSYCYGIGSQGDISAVTIKIRNTDTSTSITCTGFWLYCKTA